MQLRFLFKVKLDLRIVLKQTLRRFRSFFALRAIIYVWAKHTQQMRNQTIEHQWPKCSMNHSLYFPTNKKRIKQFRTIVLRGTSSLWLSWDSRHFIDRLSQVHQMQNRIKHIKDLSGSVCHEKFLWKMKQTSFPILRIAPVDRQGKESFRIVGRTMGLRERNYLLLYPPRKEDRMFFVRGRFVTLLICPPVENSHRSQLTGDSIGKRRSVRF